MVSTKKPAPIRRAQRLLWDALLSLLTEHSFETISVKTICDRARVHRATFYKYYEDKYNMLTRGKSQLFAQLAREIQEEQQQHSGPDLRPSLVVILNHFVLYKRFYQALLHAEKVSASLPHTVLEAWLGNQIRLHLRSPHQETHIPFTVIMQFDLGAMYNVLTWWLKNDIPVPVEQMADTLSQMLSRGHSFLLE